MGTSFYSGLARSAAAERIRERVLIAALAGSSALAWLTLWRWGSFPAGGYGHTHVHFAAQSDSAPFFAFLVGWILMLVGMMLPTSIPILAMFSKLTSERTDRWQLVSLVISGYLGVWLLSGAAVYLGVETIGRVIQVNHLMHLHGRAIGAATLVLAGAYQFSSLKYRCLEKCRSPFSFISQHWTGRNQKRQALRLGAYHGLFCVGCCWSLMLLMFTVGTGSIGSMLLLGTLMAVEKNSQWGKLFARFLGFGLLLGGVLLGFWPTT